MDPVTMIVAALAAGAAAGGQDAAKDAAKDAVHESYQRLRELLTRFGKGAQVDEIEAHPPARADELATSDAARELGESLRAESDGVLAALVPAAQELEQSVAAARGAERWSVTIANSHGIQVGDHTVMINNHGSAGPPS